MSPNKYFVKIDLMVILGFYDMKFIQFAVHVGLHVQQIVHVHVQATNPHSFGLRSLVAYMANTCYFSPEPFMVHF